MPEKHELSFEEFDARVEVEDDGRVWVSFHESSKCAFTLSASDLSLVAAFVEKHATSSWWIVSHSESAARTCPWADGAPLGLSDAAESWGMTKLGDVFQRAHARFKSHDDGHGRCRVCGGPMDFEAWLDEQDERPSRVPDRTPFPATTESHADTIRRYFNRSRSSTMPAPYTALALLVEECDKLRAEKDQPILRSEADIKQGCLQCGAEAVWTDSPQAPDYWYLPCGHSEEKLGAVVVTRTVVPA